MYSIPTVFAADATTTSITETTQASPAAAALQPETASQWQDMAFSAYRVMETKICDSLRDELARRVEAIMNYRPSPQNIYVNPVTLTATFALDGSLFRLEGESMALFLVRQCTYCGTGEFRSTPLRDLADLGHALAVWEPLHAYCQLEGAVIEE